ncbi:MAG: hypothetical protein ACRDT2_05730 [Natronosporangium sp.]
MSVPAYELPPGAGESAEAGEVLYLNPGVALVPADIAAAGEAAVHALENAADIRDARAALAEEGKSIPAGQLWSELGL